MMYSDYFALCLKFCTRACGHAAVHTLVVTFDTLPFPQPSYEGPVRHHERVNQKKYLKQKYRLGTIGTHAHNLSHNRAVSSLLRYLFLSYVDISKYTSGDHIKLPP